MTASSNFGNVFSVLIASAWLPFLPMLPIHLLTLNLIYDISQIAIPWDNVDADFIEKPRNWVATGLAKYMIFIGPVSSIFDITTFIFMWFYYGCQTPAQQTLFQSCWFVESLITQTIIIHMIRSDKIAFIQTNASVVVYSFTTVLVAFGLYLPNSFLAKPLSMESIPVYIWPYLVGVTLLYSFLTQLVKMWFIRHFKIWL